MAEPVPDIDVSRLRATFDDEFTTFTSSADGSAGWMTTFPYGGLDARTLSRNNEAEYYSDSSVGVNPFQDSNGVLSITAAPATQGVATPAGSGLTYTSGLITTYTSFKQLYGYFEVSAELPSGQGFWPAFWLLPADKTWPPELDVMEQLGKDPSTIYETVHTDDTGFNAQTQSATTLTSATSGFHTYGVDWEADTITWYIDGKAVSQVATPSDMHTPMYMLLDLAVGANGSWAGAADGTSSATMNIDYVRAYAPTEVHAPISKADAYAIAGANTFTTTAATGVLANDLDQNAQSLTATLAANGGPQHGTLALNADGSFTYTAAKGYTGSDSFTYLAGDSLAQSVPTTVSLTVAAQAPVAKADTFSTWAGHAMTNTSGVLANDTDKNGLTLSASLAPNGGPQHGTLALASDGTFMYTPNAGFAGTDSFTYLAADSLSQSTATAAISVVAHAPTGVADSYSVAPNQAVTVAAAKGVLANDGDPNALKLAASLAPNGGPQHGTLALNADGSFTYTATKGYIGSDSFIYLASDSLAQSAATTVTLAVAAQAPIAKADTSSTWAGHTLTSTVGVLSNDTDQNGLTLSASLAPNGGPQHGTLALASDGTFVYTPNAGFAGTDSFTYLASDSLSQSTATATISVLAHAPTSVADSYSIAPNQAVTITAAKGVLANDGDPNALKLSASLAPNGGPQHGTLALNADGSFTYTASTGYTGSDSFTYLASDSLAQSAATTVTLAVAAQAPIAKADTSSTWAGHTLTSTVGVLSNDTDQNGLTLSASLAPNGGPQHGTLALASDGTFVYTPNAGFAGTDSFTYVASDSLSQSTASATISVLAHAPTGVADSYTVAPNQAVTVAAYKGVLANDSDPNGLKLSAALSPNGGPQHGTLALNADGSFTYTAAKGYTGSDSFTYLAGDSLAQSTPTTVSLTVAAQAPVAKADTFSTWAGHAMTNTSGVLANDVDQNGLTLSASLAPNGGPQHGTLALASDGTFVYTPNAGFAGTDTFSYVAADSLSQSTATASISVVAHAPTSVADSYSVAPNQAVTITAAKGVLANDGDPNALKLAAALAPSGGPQHGALAFNSSGGFTYTPTSGFTGQDQFSYIASDSLTSGSPTSVVLNVTAHA